MSKAGWRELDAKANQALQRFFSRTGWEPTYTDMPFDELLAAEDDGTEEDIGEYELRQRMAGVKAFFGFLQAHGAHPSAMLKQLAAAGRACNVEPFASMTMGEVGLMFSETKAAHSWRCKILSKEISLKGMHGAKLPRQKSAESSASYAAVAKRTCNRRKKPRRAPKALPAV